MMMMMFGHKLLLMPTPQVSSEWTTCVWAEWTNRRPHAIYWVSIKFSSRIPLCLIFVCVTEYIASRGILWIHCSCWRCCYVLLQNDACIHRCYFIRIQIIIIIMMMIQSEERATCARAIRRHTWRILLTGKTKIKRIRNDYNIIKSSQNFLLLLLLFLFPFSFVHIGLYFTLWLWFNQLINWYWRTAHTSRN